MMPYRRALDALTASCQATGPTRIRVEDAVNRITAAPVNAPAAVPSCPVALQDGWAVVAEETLGASPYAPALASTAPRRVAYGDVLPDFADAVLPLPGGAAGPGAFEILSAVAPGENTRARAGDLAEGEALVAAGMKLEALHIAMLKLAGIENVGVRVPRVRILSQCDPGHWLAAAAEREGAQSRIEHWHASTAACPAVNLAEVEADLVIGVGFQSMRDNVLRAVELSGIMLFDSIALRPGETICGGVVHCKAGPDRVDSADPDGLRIAQRTGRLPVLFIPGRMECVFAAWLLFVRPCLQRLADAVCRDVEERLSLTRKITSMPGISELALVRRVSAQGGNAMLWEPLAAAEITLSAIAHADAWLLAEAGSEGYAAGQSVGANLL